MPIKADTFGSIPRSNIVGGQRGYPLILREGHVQREQVVVEELLVWQITQSTAQARSPSAQLLVAVLQSLHTGSELDSFS